MHGNPIVNFKSLRFTANSMLLAFTAGAVFTSPLAQAGQVWALDDSGQLFSYETAGSVGGENKVAVHQNFESISADTALTDNQIRGLFSTRNLANIINNGTPGMSVVKDPANSGRGNVFQVSFRKGALKIKDGGGQWVTNLDSSNEYYFAYDMYVRKGFNWPLLSKLPGLFGGDLGSVTGGGIGDGIHGWAARQIMASERKDGDTEGWKNIGDGNLAGTPHVLDKTFTARYNDMLDDEWDSNSARLVPEKWTRIEQRVKLNDPGKPNGIYQAWVDGKLVWNANNLTYRVVDTLKVDAISFVWYYGGSGSDFAAREDQAMFFDNFVAWTPTTSTSTSTSTSTRTGTRTGTRTSTRTSTRTRTSTSTGTRTGTSTSTSTGTRTSTSTSTRTRNRKR